jgi:hypothetical protein
MLNEDNYFSPENSLKYMGSSQFKSFMKCEGKALAEITGEYREEPSDSLLIGSYVDAYYEGSLEQFAIKTPQIFTQKGELRAQYKHANKVIERAERDKLFSQFMSGEKQVIMTGEIAGVPYKIKIDSYHAGKCIVDLKCVKDFDQIWDRQNRMYQNFVDFWGYTYQGAIYQEIVRQNTGKTLPFYIAAVTKEKEPDLNVFYIPNDTLEEKLQTVKQLSPRFEQIKKGFLKPQKCGCCNYCRFSKTLIEPINYTSMITEEIIDV